MRKSFALLMFFATISFGVFAQKIVKGQILEAKTNLPIIGASIIEKGPEKPGGVISDFNGKFELKTSASEIEVSYLGFKSQHFQIFGDTILTVILNYNIYELATPIICWTPTPDYQKPIALKTLNTKDLNINNSTIITPALNRVPGVYMHSGALNTNRITIRGIGNRSPFATAKIKAYIDDIPLTNGSGETTIEDMDLCILGKVTVLKGPTSSIYGAGLGGMLYLSTSETILPKTEFSLDNTIGSYGLIRSVLSFKNSSDGKNQLNAVLNSTVSDGYRDNNEYTRTSFVVYGKFHLNDKETISVFGNYVFLDAQIPSSLDSTDYTDNPQKAARSWAFVKGYEKTRKGIVGTSYKSIIGDHFSQSSSVYMAFRNSFELRPFNILRENNFMFGARTEWAYDNHYSNSNNHFEIRIGAEVFSERHLWLTNRTIGSNTPGNPLEDIREIREYINAFGLTKFDFHEHTTIAAGVNVNFTVFNIYDFRLNQFNHHNFPLIWSPYLSIGHKLGSSKGWNNNISLHAKVSHGFSSPTLEETLNPNGNINPDIMHEQGWNFEFGSRGRIFNTLRYHFSIYSMHIQDLLVARRIDFDQYIGINAGKTLHNGFELELNQAFHFNAFALNLFASYTFADYKFIEFIDGEEDYSGNQLTGSPRHLLNFGIDATFNSFYGNIQYNFVDEMPMRDDNSVYSDAYQLLNMKVGYHFALGKKWFLDFFAGINNILDEKYASMIQINASSFGGQTPRYYYPGLPRNYYFGVKVSFAIN